MSVILPRCKDYPVSSCTATTPTVYWGQLPPMSQHYPHSHHLRLSPWVLLLLGTLLLVILTLLLIKRPAQTLNPTISATPPALMTSVLSQQPELSDFSQIINPSWLISSPEVLIAPTNTALQALPPNQLQSLKNSSDPLMTYSFFTSYLFRSSASLGSLRDGQVLVDISGSKSLLVSHQGSSWKVGNAILTGQEFTTLNGRIWPATSLIK